MFRGFTTFTCDNCGNKFRGMDTEYAATVYTTPKRCPNCGSIHTYPKSFFGLNKVIYKKIWETMDRKG